MTSIWLRELTFLIDLNEIERDDTVFVSLDFTVQGGEYVTVSTLDAPQVGASVRVADDSGSIYTAEIVQIASPRDFVVRIDWGSEVPKIDLVWPGSSAAQDVVVTVDSPTLPAVAA